MSLFGGIEAGGTKFVCAVGSGPDDLRNEIRYDTTTPDETIQRAIEYFIDQNRSEKLIATGIGSFGPLNLNPASPTYGFITSTPKPNWQNSDFYGRVKAALDIPIGFDTDVNTAALGEYEWGAALGLTDFIYLTVGTGIGGGGMINGKLLHGLLHPEMGHIFISRHPLDDYQGSCPYHQNNCFEGLASGPAMEGRWGMKAENLIDNHAAWDLEAEYIAMALINYICTLSPQRIIIGGGVMQQPTLLPLIHDYLQKLLNDYIQVSEIIENIDSYVVHPGLGNKAGIFGAIALAKKAYLNYKINND
jgi:fructokinase